MELIARKDNKRLAARREEFHKTEERMEKLTAVISHRRKLYSKLKATYESKKLSCTRRVPHQAEQPTFKPRLIAHQHMGCEH